MSPFKIKPCQLKDIDITSLKSMLSLAGNLLNNEWVLVEQGQADLYIYSLDNEESKIAWQNHSDGFTAILTSMENTSEATDIILKKPLRTKNFSEALNTIEDKIKLDHQAQKASNKTTEIPSKKQAAKLKEKQNKPSLFASISKRLTGKKKPAKDLPALNFYLPEKKPSKPDTILDPNLLKKWLDELSDKDAEKITSAILAHIVPLNRATIPAETRLALLDVYRQPIRKLIFNRDIVAINREKNAPSEFLKSVKSLNLLLEELAVGYKILVIEAYQQGKRPNLSDLFLIVINRSAELLSLLIVHAYRYYRSAPTNTLHELHQLYVYCEVSKTLHTLPSTKELSTTVSFFNLYSQIMLTGIADPYSLAKFEVFRLYNIMANMADKVTIMPLTNEQKKVTKGLLLSSNFCIDSTSDHIPISLSKVGIDKRSLSFSRIFSTEGVLKAIEDIFKKASTSASISAYDLDIQLLKKVIPQINTTYQRKHQRLPSVLPHSINTIHGVVAIHTALTQDIYKHSLELTVLDRSDSGIMANRDSAGCHKLNINEILGIFEQDQSARLATIRWLHTDNNDITSIGIDLHAGNPTAVTFIPDGETEILCGLMLSEDDESKQPAMLVTDRGVYSKNRVFRIKEGDETYIIKAEEMINNGFNYEQFSFKVKQS